MLLLSVLSLLHCFSEKEQKHFTISSLLRAFTWRTHFLVTTFYKVSPLLHIGNEQGNIPSGIKEIGERIL